MKKKLRNYFLTGLAVLLPIVITIYIFVLTFKFIDSIFGRYLNALLNEYWGISVYGLGFLLTLVIVLITGFLATNIFFKRTMPFMERWFARFPLVSKVYLPAKEMINFLFSPHQVAFKKVVLVEYPRKGGYSVGFLVSEHVNLKIPQNNDLIAVFIPSTPSPISGFLFLAPKNEVIYLDIPVETGIKIIVTGGILLSQKTNINDLNQTNAKNMET